MEELPKMFAKSAELLVSMKRIEGFLLSKEINQSYIIQDSLDNTDLSIRITNGNFCWKTGGRMLTHSDSIGASTPRTPRMDASPTKKMSFEMGKAMSENSRHYGIAVLEDINIEIKKGSFVVVLGE
jgi:hypothetical protein